MTELSILFASISPNFHILPTALNNCLPSPLYPAKVVWSLVVFSQQGSSTTVIYKGANGDFKGANGTSQGTWCAEIPGSASESF